MRTTCRPTHATRVLTDRAAGAAGGQSRRDHGGPGERDRTVTIPRRLRRALVPGRPPSTPPLRPGRELTGMMYECCPVDFDPVPAPHWCGFRGAGFFNAAAPRRGFATGQAKRRHPVHDNVRDLDFDLSPADAVSAS